MHTPSGIVVANAATTLARQLVFVHARKLAQIFDYDTPRMDHRSEYPLK